MDNRDLIMHGKQIKNLHQLFHYNCYSKGLQLLQKQLLKGIRTNRTLIL